jgi:hypothetical protein
MVVPPSVSWSHAMAALPVALVMTVVSPRHDRFAGA